MIGIYCTFVSVSVLVLIFLFVSSDEEYIDIVLSKSIPVITFSSPVTWKFTKDLKSLSTGLANA